MIGPAREAVVAARVALVTPGGDAILLRTFEARAPVPGADPRDLAGAMGTALGEVIRRIGDAVGAALVSRRSR